jgi:hypothetical protein
VLVGISDGTWIEVIEKLSPSTWTKEGARIPFSDTDQLIVGNLSEIEDGEQVHVEPVG